MEARNDYAIRKNLHTRAAPGRGGGGRCGLGDLLLSLCPTPRSLLLRLDISQVARGFRAAPHLPKLEAFVGTRKSASRGTFAVFVHSSGFAFVLTLSSGLALGLGDSSALGCKAKLAHGEGRARAGEKEGGTGGGGGLALGMRAWPTGGVSKSLHRWPLHPSAGQVTRA